MCRCTIYNDEQHNHPTKQKNTSWFHHTVAYVIASTVECITFLPLPCPEKSRAAYWICKEKKNEICCVSVSCLQTLLLYKDHEDYTRVDFVYMRYIVLDMYICVDLV